jgi:DnaJ-class molecular chaperone
MDTYETLKDAMKREEYHRCGMLKLRRRLKRRGRVKKRRGEQGKDELVGLLKWLDY